jgi:hypothetical protein
MCQLPLSPVCSHLVLTKLDMVKPGPDVIKLLFSLTLFLSLIFAAFPLRKGHFCKGAPNLP